MIARRLFKTHEFYLALVLLALSFGIGTIEPAFFSLSNLFGLCKNASVMGIMALGVLMVLVSGGIDVSFTAIAAFSMYVTANLLLQWDYAGSVLTALVLSGVVGAALGSINAFFIAQYNLPTLIVTLGTASLFRGFLLAFVGTSVINNLPEGMIRFSKTQLWTSQQSNDVIVGLSPAFLIFIGAAVAVGLFLRYTITGRGIYALGNNPEAARRIGFNVSAIQYVLYCFVGFLSGMAGAVHACLMRNANPFDLVGMELNVIAAAVLGGASIMGGRGTVIGTLLGVFLLVLVNNSLILLKVPSYWQKVAVGVIIILSTSITAYREKRVRGNTQ